MSETTLMSGDTAPPTDTAPAATTTTTDPLPLVGDNGAFRPDWHSTLGDGFDNLPDNVKGIKDLPTLVKGFTEGQGMIAKHGQTIGDLKKQLEENTPQGAPDAYTFASKPDGVLEADWNQENADMWADVLKEQGINDNAATALVDKFSAVMAESKAAEDVAAQQATEQSVQALKDEWKGDFDGNLEKAIKVAEKIGLDTSDPTVGNNPSIIKAMAKIADSVSESVIKGAGAGNTAGITPNEGSRAEAKKIVQDSSHPMHAAFNDPGSPQHAYAQQEVGRLNAEYASMFKS